MAWQVMSPRRVAPFSCGLARGTWLTKVPKICPQPGAQKRLFCGRHWSETQASRCAACDEIIFQREQVYEFGKSYHIRHFCCQICDGNLTQVRLFFRFDSYSFSFALVATTDRGAGLRCSSTPSCREGESRIASHASGRTLPTNATRVASQSTRHRATVERYPPSPRARIFRISTARPTSQARDAAPVIANSGHIGTAWAARLQVSVKGKNWHGACFKCCVCPNSPVPSLHMRIHAPTPKITLMKTTKASGPCRFDLVPTNVYSIERLGVTRYVSTGL